METGVLYSNIEISEITKQTKKLPSKIVPFWSKKIRENMKLLRKRIKF